MKPTGTVLLNRPEIAALLGVDECITAVEEAFRLQGEGKAPPPGILAMHSHGGGFHIKAAILELGRSYFAAKVNGNFFQNAERFGLPNIQGILVLCDAENGYPLALMDSIEITIIRTGAATAVAAKYLSQAEAGRVAICGCGNQGRISLRAISRVRTLESVNAYDIDYSRAHRFAEEMSNELMIEVRPVRSVREAVRASQICVTCTPSRQHFLSLEDLGSGAFVAAVGADAPDKQELDPGLLAGAKVVVDNLEQCASIGELHHALETGLMTRESVHAELSEVITGKKPGRTSEEEIIIFDSTGTALQDVAAAAIVYEKAVQRKMGRWMEFS